MRLNTKDVVVISVVLFVSILTIYSISSRPTFLFGDTARVFEEKFVADYENNIPEGWQIININELGLIAIPDTLEVREEGSTIDVFNRAGKEIIYKLSGITEPNTESKLVIQQKGLNEADRSSFASYARVMINIYNMEDNLLPTRYEKLNLSNNELNDIKNELVSSLDESATLFNIEFRDPTIEMVKVNNIDAIKFTYYRNLSGSPEAYVEQYKFFNSDQYIEVILSYRVTDSGTWEQDFSEIIKTFIITN